MSSRTGFIQIRDHEFEDAQFVPPEYPVPWRAIFLSVLLFVLGSIGIVISALLMTGIIATSVSGVPFLILGLLCFIPGSYYTYIAYYAYYGYEGFDFSQLPELD
ncbi:uncharacterized protein VTP21DRAFT_6968 [Calcarisporiella thermophila]|uniref:uncharacterized protein n=1 Tax=Calcarisporiella thermophila TaxID=911321 RepID=UPI0037436501